MMHRPHSHAVEGRNFESNFRDSRIESYRGCVKHLLTLAQHDSRTMVRFYEQLQKASYTEKAKHVVKGLFLVP
jgi:hypothetical protein